jgi:hypothetical protein
MGQRGVPDEPASAPTARAAQPTERRVDNGFSISGLLAVWRHTRSPRLLEVASACGRAMARDFLTETAIHPILQMPSRAPLPYERRWSREPGCFQLKSAMAWYDLAEATSDDTFTLWYERALRMALDSSPPSPPAPLT